MKKKIINKYISTLKNEIKNKDIFILCAGNSLSGFHKDFFKNKITISVNRVFEIIKTDYIIFKDLNEVFTIEYLKKFKVLNDPKTKIIYSENKYGDPENEIKNELNFTNAFRFKNLSKISINQKPDFKAINKKNYLINSYSTTSSAMHLAAHLGAKDIYLIGHDCCKYDGKYYIKNYYSKKFLFRGGFRNSFFKQIYKDHQKTADVLKKKFKVNFYSIYNDTSLRALKKKTSFF